LDCEDSVRRDSAGRDGVGPVFSIVAADNAQGQDSVDRAVEFISGAIRTGAAIAAGEVGERYFKYSRTFATRIVCGKSSAPQKRLNFNSRAGQNQIFGPNFFMDLLFSSP
jgi:hypothetical protein